MPPPARLQHEIKTDRQLNYKQLVTVADSTLQKIESIVRELPSKEQRLHDPVLIDNNQFCSVESLKIIQPPFVSLTPVYAAVNRPPVESLP